MLSAPQGRGPLVRQGLDDRVLDPQVFTGKRVLLVGGGDSAFDWAVNLQGIAQRVVMIHRRDGFPAHAATVRQVQELCAAGRWSYAPSGS
ncbi:MAG TPA: NAD-binding protein [Gemmatimonadales bacterium]|nr:NAD-binding protein [Gemmatimonadales bacterium]